MRVVRDADGHVALDPTGKRTGRGAYLCHDPACWDQALRRHGLERALRIETFLPEDRAALEQIARDLTVPQDQIASSILTYIDELHRRDRLPYEALVRTVVVAPCLPRRQGVKDDTYLSQTGARAR